MSTSLTKAMSILLELANTRQGCSVRQLADRLQLSRSTVHRLLHALGESDMTTQDTATGHYRLGSATLRLGVAMLDQLDVRTKALPQMQRLADRTTETVGLNVRVGGARMYVEQMESPHQLKAKAETGHLYPLHSGAPGKVLLSGLTDAEINQCLEESALVALTPQTPVTPSEILRSVADIRTHGYAAAFEETIRGVNTIAAPIRDHTRAVCAALSISGPTSRFDEERMREATEWLLESVAATSAHLGFSGAQR